MPDKPDNSVAVTIEVAEEELPQRLDRFLASHPDLDLTRSRVQRLIAEGLVEVNGQPALKKYSVRPGDELSLTIPPLPPREAVAEEIPLDVIFEDDHLIVVNKPSGLVTHPGVGNRTGTLVNALMFRYGSLATGSTADRPGVVHRLDKNTSGLLIVARTDEVLLKLQRQLQEREIKRQYLALVCGHVKDDSGTIDAPIGRSLRDRKKMAVTDINSREAVTEYRLINRFTSYDLIEASLQTGRTHQIRVHFAYLGHPVLGDPDYGGREKWVRGMFAPERPLARNILDTLPRQALHAYQLSFEHPMTGVKVALRSDLPDDFQNVLDILRTEQQEPD
ncbi:MAG: RluA family pseudouridine synthase [candidate division Zixibacteria bacterium]|nr:RluA family pseudouridine synthase [candidate division Zixibacteria bacterium]